MTAKEMHYDFKQKLNRIDSQQYRNLKVPEIDWKLNEAQELLVKMIAQPRLQSRLGFETSQRVIDDISTLVVNQNYDTGQTVVPFPHITGGGDETYLAALPDDYWFYIKSFAYTTKGNCSLYKLRTVITQHDDESELSPFNKSSFEWKVVNIRFIREGIRLYTDGTFIINKLCLDYLLKPRIIHNAEDWVNGSYDTLDGITLTGTQDSELPSGVHREIVDLAVLITAGDLSLPDYILKKNKLALS